MEYAIGNEHTEIIRFMLNNGKNDDEDSGQRKQIEEEEEEKEETLADELAKLKEKISKIENKYRNLKEVNHQKSVEINKLKNIISLLKGKGNSFKLEDYKEESILNENDTSIEKLITSIEKKNFVMKEMKNFDQNQLQQFVDKYNFFFNYHHPYLIQFQGVNFGDDKRPPSLIYSYEPKTLESMIQNNELTEKQKNKIAVEIVLGMKFIHSRNLVHSNLKPSNILISKDNHVRINDFYLNKIEELKSKNVDSLRYLAPELCENEEQIHLTNKADVYSFGIVLSYLITNKHADEDLKLLCIKAIPYKLYLEVNWVQKLVRRCLYPYPEKRASFDEVLEIMREHNFDLFNDNFSELSQNEQDNLKQEIEKEIMMTEAFEYLHQDE